MSDQSQYLSLDKYKEQTKHLSDSGYFAFRGQCCSSWSLEPGILRRIKKTYLGIGQSSLLLEFAKDITIELLKSARDRKYFKKDECDWNILATLQHYGAATPLLDFTWNPLVAMYFACQPFTNNGIESDGKMFCINSSKQRPISTNSPIIALRNPADINIDSVFGGPHAIWYWKLPKDFPCKRSEKQQSMFIFGRGLYRSYSTNKLIDDLKVLMVPASLKTEFLKVLNEKHDISEQTLFPDIHVFAQYNSYDKEIRHFSAEEHYNQGEELWKEGNPEWAADYYKMAYLKKTDWVDARCKYALALSWNGEQSKALETIEDSIASLGENWMLLACKAVVNEVIEKDWRVDYEKAQINACKLNQMQELMTFINKHGSTIAILSEKNREKETGCVNDLDEVHG